MLKVGSQTVKLTGESDIIISTTKNPAATIKIDDESAEGILVKVVYRNGSFFLVGEETEFTNVQLTPSCYYLTQPRERVVLQPGDVF